MDAPEAESFDFTTRWRLQDPTLVLNAAKQQLDLIVQVGSTLLDGDIRARAVDAGLGSTEEFAAVDVTGKVAVVTRSDTVSASARAANAAAAGAKLLIVVNDADGELSEWVGSEDYTTDVAIPVSAISGVQGRGLLEAIAAPKPVTITGEGIAVAGEVFDIARYSDGSVPENLDYTPKELARIDTTYYGEQGATVGEYRYDFVPSTQYGTGFPMRTERGIERAEWVNTDQVEWYQNVSAIDWGWDIRDVVRAYEPGERTEASYFGSVVRPYVGPGYWAPLRSGDGIQLNLPSWSDGDSAQRTGAFDTYAGTPGIAQSIELHLDGELVKTSQYQGLNGWDIADGEHDVRVVNTATHDGTATPSSTMTRTEWAFSSTWNSTDYTRHILPMLQAYYDVDLDGSGKVGAERKKGTPVRLGLELGHIAGAVGSGAITGATLEARVAGGDWTVIDLDVTSTDDSGPGEPPAGGFPEARAFLTTYDADIRVPDAGGWVDLRVTATDAEGGTFSQEIERAFEAASIK
ncbi:PA domain-containing protein [Agromyces neolithicus]